jgi:hypothetical protein
MNYGAWGGISYRKRSKYIAYERAEPGKQIEELVHEYDVLSKKYHSEKSLNANNSLVLG